MDPSLVLPRMQRPRRSPSSGSLRRLHPRILPGRIVTCNRKVGQPEGVALSRRMPAVGCDRDGVRGARELVSSVANFCPIKFDRSRRYFRVYSHANRTLSQTAAIGRVFSANHRKQPNKKEPARMNRAGLPCETSRAQKVLPRCGLRLAPPFFLSRKFLCCFRSLCQSRVTRAPQPRPPSVSRRLA